MAAKVLVLKVQGGLGNRMRALASADRWAAATGRRLYYSWPTGPRFSASLDDLWVTPYRHISSRVANGLARAVGGYKGSDDITVEDPRRLLVLRTESVLFLGSPELEPWFLPLRRLQPVPEVVNRVTDTSRAWVGVPAVGVMIRAHEHAHPKTRQTSPPEWFYARMSAMRAEDPELPFFLSTDSPEVSSEVHARFPGVIELRKRAGYNTHEALIESVCDLYLLAGTTYILGSYWSSFSDVAARLSGHGGYETPRSGPKQTWTSRRALVASPPL